MLELVLSSQFCPSISAILALLVSCIENPTLTRLSYGRLEPRPRVNPSGAVELA